MAALARALPLALALAATTTSALLLPTPTTNVTLDALFADVNSVDDLVAFFGKPGPYKTKAYMRKTAHVIEPVGIDAPFKTVVFSKGNGALCGGINAYSPILTKVASFGIATVTPCEGTYIGPTALKNNILELKKSGFASDVALGGHSLGGNSVLGIAPEDDLDIKAVGLFTGTTCILNIPHCNPGGVTAPFMQLVPNLDVQSGGNIASIYNPVKGPKLYASFAGEHNAAIWGLSAVQPWIVAFYTLFLDAIQDEKIAALSADMLFGDAPKSFRNASPFSGALVSFPDDAEDSAAPEVAAFSLLRAPPPPAPAPDAPTAAPDAPLALAAAAFRASSPPADAAFASAGR